MAAGTIVPFVSLVRVIVAPGMTPPCPSLSMPVIVPVVSNCADEIYAVKKNSVKANPVIQRPLMRCSCSPSGLLSDRAVADAGEFVVGPGSCSCRIDRSNGLCRRRVDRRRTVAPFTPDIGEHCGNLVIAHRAADGRH